MKHYTVKQPFSLKERVLIMADDEIFAELIRNMYHVYSPKTRKRLGTVSEVEFINFV